MEGPRAHGREGLRGPKRLSFEGESELVFRPPDTHSWLRTSRRPRLVGMEACTLRAHTGRCHFHLGHLHRDLVASLGRWGPVPFAEG